MKKFVLTQQRNIIVLPKAMNTIENSFKNRYLKVKSMQCAYQELFKALLKIPDKEVHSRVINAINEEKEEMICDKCRQPVSKPITVDIGTQTAFFETATSSSNEPLSLIKTFNSDENSRSTPNNMDQTLNENTTEKSDEDPPKTKRKRRRKIQLPQVLKKSQVQQQHKPIQQKRKAETLKVVDGGKFDLPKRSRSDSVSSTGTNYSNIVPEDCMPELLAQVTKPVNIEEVLHNIMATELLKSETTQADGLIPIHSAITNKLYLPLKRQIYVWKKFKKIDLNELLTDDDRDCLQLAIEWNSPYQIIEELILNGLNLNSLDTQSNTIIHMAILNEIDVNAFELLMKKIDLKMLLKLNDEGYTPLHLAVRQDNYVLCEATMNIMDLRLSEGVTYLRNIENRSSKENFLIYYEKCCEQLSQNNPILQIKSQENVKQKLVNAGERCSGYTALLFAIENKMEHFIYFLLAHFANPLITNHSQQNSISYFGESAKMLNLSLKIDRVMEQVITLLKV